MTNQTVREALEALFAGLHDGKSAQWLDYYGEPDLSANGRRFNALMGLNAYLDAAMMLVPRGWLVTIQRGFDDDGEYFSHVELTDSFSVGRGHDLEDEVTVTARQGARAAFHDPTALALCAAIRAALEEKPCPNCHGTGAVDYDPNQEIEPWME